MRRFVWRMCKNGAIQHANIREETNKKKSAEKFRLRYESATGVPRVEGAERGGGEGGVLMA